MADLILDNFDSGADGDNLGARSGWAGYNGDAIELDNTQAQSGALSVVRSGVGDNVCYYSFAKQSTGKHTYDFYFYLATAPASAVALCQASEGAYGWGNNNWPLWFGARVWDAGSYELIYRTASDWTQITTVTYAEWHRAEIELDQDTNTINIWIDGTQRVTSGAFQNDADPDRFNLTDESDVSNWLDTLHVYTGARAGAVTAKAKWYYDLLRRA